LSVLGTATLNIAGNRRRADKAHRLDVLMVQERIDRDFVALHDIEETGWQSRLSHQLGKQERSRWVALTRLEHEGIAAGDRNRKHPARDHARKIERCDACHDPERLARHPVVQAGGYLLGEITLEQLRNTASKLNHLDSAHHLAVSIAQDLAVLAGDHG